MTPEDKPFFVGYLGAPRELRAFLISFILSLTIFFGIMGWFLSSSQADPGNASFLPGRQTLVGVLEARPYPMLHVLEGSNRIETGTTVLMSGGGKRGVQGRADGFDGKYVRISGQALQRGDLEMIQLRGGMQGLADMSETEAPEIVSEDLGRWRLEGEICDGKCLTGAMRPGTGLAHRACANLCLTGGVPPVFVSAQPVQGSEFLMIGDKDGNALTDRLLDFTALYVSLEGTIERRGSMLVFLVDLESLKVLP